MLNFKSKLKILLVVGIVGCVFFISFKMVLAAIWTEPVSSPPFDNARSPIHQQIGETSQEGPVNIKGEAEAGRIEATEICICPNEESGSCSDFTDNCVRDWGEIMGGLWSSGDGNDIYFNNGQVAVGTEATEQELCLNDDCITEWPEGSVPVLKTRERTIEDRFCPGYSAPFSHAIQSSEILSPDAVELVSATLTLDLAGFNSRNYAIYVGWPEEILKGVCTPAASSNCSSPNYDSCLTDIDVTEEIKAYSNRLIIKVVDQDGASDVGMNIRLTVVESYIEYESGTTPWVAGTGNISYDGNVGIGTVSPNRRLHIYQTTGTNAEIDIQSVIGAEEHWAILQDRTSEDLMFWNNDAVGEQNILTITNEGEVGIGTKTPNRLLHLYQIDDDLNDGIQIPNAELDIQSVAGANRHWGIYQDNGTEDLNFWHEDGDNVLTLTNEGDVNVNGLIRTGRYATDNLPTCDANTLGAIVFDTDEDSLYVCKSTGWGIDIGDPSELTAADINEMAPADGAVAVTSILISEGADEAAIIVNCPDLSVANAAAIFNNPNITIVNASNIFTNSNLQTPKAAAIAEHPNLEGDRTQSILAGMHSVLKIVDIVTTNATNKTFYSDSSISGTNRYNNLTIDEGVVLTVTGQPGIIIANSIINNGTIDKSYSGGGGGHNRSSGAGRGGDGGGGLIIFTGSLNNNSIIQANSGDGTGHGSCSVRHNGFGGGGGVINRIGAYNVGDGGDSGYEDNYYAAPPFRGIGYFGAGGVGTGSSGGYYGGNGGNVSYVDYNSVEDLFYVQKEMVAEWYIVNVAGKTVTTVVSLNSYGAGGGSGYCGGGGIIHSGGGGGGGHIIVTANSFDNSDSIIRANGGNGGGYRNCAMVGGGGGGGMIYGLYNTLIDGGALTAEGGLGGSCNEAVYGASVAEDGTDGTAVVYDISIY